MKKRRKPWIRYEPKHNLSAVHLNWHTSMINGKGVCGVLDDSSRFILAGGEFATATGDASIGLVRKVRDDFGVVRKIREVITDHGSQFFANNGQQMVNPTEFHSMRCLLKIGIKHM